MTLSKLAARLVSTTLALSTAAFAEDVAPASTNYSSTAVQSTAVQPAVEPPPPCYFRDRPCSKYPHLALGFDLGAGAFEEGQPFGFGAGTGSATSWGPSWGFRVGVELASWFAIDARYAGILNEINKEFAPNGAARMVTNGAALEVRFTIPLPYVQPYLFGGAGYYSTSINGSYPSRTQTRLHSSASLGFPMGIGFAVPITDSMSLGAEATYHFYLGESFSNEEELAGADSTTFNALLRWRL